MSTPDTRAVSLKITEEDMDDCAWCAGSITSDTENRWVVANVYIDCCLVPTCKLCHGTARKWDRIEHWHTDCYFADEPYGPPATVKKPRKPKGTE
jgi:hypothetical protein